jgi:amino-acid N-acetyltransferase
MVKSSIPITPDILDARSLQPLLRVSPERIKAQGIYLHKATVRDAAEIMQLVNEFAVQNLMLNRGPQYLYENIRDYVIAVDPEIAVRQTSKGETLTLIVGCAGLHVLWQDLGEIRSLAVHPDYQQLGIGKKMVEYILDEALNLKLKKLFTFTLDEAFFRGLGFNTLKHKDLPPKVWGECSNCPKYFRCDEVGMILKI